MILLTRDKILSLPKDVIAYFSTFQIRCNSNSVPHFDIFSSFIFYYSLPSNKDMHNCVLHSRCIVLSLPQLPTFWGHQGWWHELFQQNGCGHMISAHSIAPIALLTPPSGVTSRSDMWKQNILSKHNAHFGYRVLMYVHDIVAWTSEPGKPLLVFWPLTLTPLCLWIRDSASAITDASPRDSSCPAWRCLSSTWY